MRQIQTDRTRRIRPTGLVVCLACVFVLACEGDAPPSPPELELATVSRVDAREAPPVIEVRITRDAISVDFSRFAEFRARRVEELADSKAGAPPESSVLDKWRRERVSHDFDVPPPRPPKHLEPEPEPKASAICRMLSGPCSWFYKRDLHEDLDHLGEKGDNLPETHPDAPSRMRTILELDDGELPDKEAKAELEEAFRSISRPMDIWIRFLEAQRLQNTFVISAEGDVPFSTLVTVIMAVRFTELWFKVQTPDGRTGFGYYESHKMMMCCTEPSPEAKPLLCRFPWVVITEDEMRLDICRDQILADSPEARIVKSQALIERKLSPILGDYHLPDDAKHAGNGHTQCTRLDDVDGDVVREQDIRTMHRPLGDRPPHEVASSLAETLVETPKTGPCPELRILVLPQSARRVSVETFLAAFQAFKTDRRYSIPIVEWPRDHSVD